MTEHIITRRSLLTGLIAAPAVVAASSLMPVKAVLWSQPSIILPEEWEALNERWETLSGRVVRWRVHFDDARSPT